MCIRDSVNIVWKVVCRAVRLWSCVVDPASILSGRLYAGLLVCGLVLLKPNLSASPTETMFTGKYLPKNLSTEANHVLS